MSDGREERKGAREASRVGATGDRGLEPRENMCRAGIAMRIGEPERRDS